MPINSCSNGDTDSVQHCRGRALAASGKKVLVVDSDESNLCLPLLLGVGQPTVMMDALGGRPGTKEKLRQAADHHHEDAFFKPAMAFDDLPADCIAEADGIRLLVIAGVAYGASALMTLLPARAASRVPVAAALRYE